MMKSYARMTPIGKFKCAAAKSVTLNVIIAARVLQWR